MADDEALKTVAKRRKLDEVGCDIDNGDGTGEIDFAKDRESPTKQGGRGASASGDSRDGRRERDAAERAPEDPTRARERARDERTITTMTDDKVKEIIAKVQEYGGAMTSDQLREVIEGIQGEDGRVKKYKDEGAGLGGMVKGGGAGLDVTVKGAGKG